MLYNYFVYFLKFLNFFFSVSWQLNSFCIHVSYLYKHLLVPYRAHPPRKVSLSSLLDTYFYAGDFQHTLIRAIRSWGHEGGISYLTLDQCMFCTKFSICYIHIHFTYKSYKIILPVSENLEILGSITSVISLQKWPISYVIYVWNLFIVSNMLHTCVAWWYLYIN